MPNVGFCNCTGLFRADSCRNALRNLYCNVNCCPYKGMCDNDLHQSKKVYLARSLRTSRLGVATTGKHPVRVAINPERMGGLMRFVKRYCDPVAKFVEVRNGRRTTVVVVTAESVAERRSALPAVMTCGLYVVAGALNVATAISKAVVIRDTTKGSRNAVVMCGTS
ncbi:hypothetical protein F442_05932 [Phytophthora nicotianae P10297]|uniref:Uncharacterized protein n=1 Tax=Phytophthora nicotianae P10297 TaxID=1317064 RepID=W2ZMW0_PHYNI|nr:hypothetical protein F442_05932 [Phytophthora nicotianae P10297]